MDISKIKEIIKFNVGSILYFIKDNSIELAFEIITGDHIIVHNIQENSHKHCTMEDIMEMEGHYFQTNKISQ